MKILLLLITVSALLAQETRRDVITPAANPADDAKSNSDKVPDVYAIPGHFEKVVILRFKNGADLLAGIESMVKQERIRNGVILSALGSVTSYHVHQVSNRSFPSRDTFEKNPTGAADLIGMNGYVINGRVHAHITLANPDKAFGGHLEPGTAVFTFAVVTIGVLNDGIDITQVDNKSYR